MSHMEFYRLVLHVLQIASIANVFMSLFTANSLFLMFTNKIKSLAIIVMTSASIVLTMGVLLAGSGFENLVFAYLQSSIFAGNNIYSLCK